MKLLYRPQSKFFLWLFMSMLPLLFSLGPAELVAQAGSSPMTVQGRVIFDDGQPVRGATVKVTSISLVQTLLHTLQPGTASEPSLTHETITSANGDFRLALATNFSGKVLVEVSFVSAGMPTIETAKLRDVQGASVEIGPIVIPNPQGAEIPVANGVGQTADGSIQIINLPATVDRLFGGTYYPTGNIHALPGDSTESNQIPLNTAVSLWLEALDANGQPVDKLGQVAIIRSRIPKFRWNNLEDINTGTDRIEIPIYTYNEFTHMWEQMGAGWLEDAHRTVMPEAAQSIILDSTFNGELFSTFTTTHFSWMNVDYPYIGPWELGRLDVSRRNNPCLYTAMNLAQTIALSQAGRDAYAQFNIPGGDLTAELADGAGPELKSDNLGGDYGEFRGNEQRDRDDQFYMGEQIWDGCGADATLEQKKDTALIMAVTIVHETAHWKWDTKHDGGKWTNAEPGGEAGNTLELELFGGLITNDNGIYRDGVPVDNATRDRWLDPANWPPPAANTPGIAAAEVDPSLLALASPALLQSFAAQAIVASAVTTSPLRLTLSSPLDDYTLGKAITVTVEYRNIAEYPMEVLHIEHFMEGHPLWFEIVRLEDESRVPFHGSRTKRHIDWDEHFVTLQPGETWQKSVNLVENTQTGDQHYNFTRGGTYALRAHYAPHYGLPAVTSNVITVTLSGGGQVAGLVTSSLTGEPIAGTMIHAIRNTHLVHTATTDIEGHYLIPELPAGAYTFEVSAPGFLHNFQSNIQITASQTTTVDVTLAPLLIQGELHAVLTWGELPHDLDTQFWLPASVPYTIDYRNQGALDRCPFASLTVDGTKTSGAETIIVKQQPHSGTYIYAVYNYSGLPDLKASQAQVQLFDATGLIHTFVVPTVGAGRWWHVFNMDGETGRVTEVNQLLANSPAPYTVSNRCD